MSVLRRKEKLFLIIGLIIILSISFFIRAYRISDESLYGDEPYSIFHAQKSLSELKDIFLHDQNPPMHIALLHLWLGLFGVGDVSAKMFSVSCSILAGLVLFFFSKKYLNNFTAIFAFFLFLFSNAQQFFATEVRPYALVQLLCILSLFAYFGLLAKPQKKHILFLFLSNLALLFTHYISVFILVVEFLFIWFYFNKNRQAFIYYFISQVMLVVAFIPWVSVLLSNMPKEGSFWNHAPNYEEFRWHTNILAGSEMLFYVFNGLLLLCLILLVLNKYKKFLIGDFNTKYFIFFFCLYLIPIGLDYIVSQKTPVFLTRYILYTTFGLFLSISYFISEIEIKPLYKWLLVSPIVLIVLFSFKITQEREDDWKSLIPLVKSKMDDKTVIFVSASYKAKDFAFYYDIESFKNYNHFAESLAKQQVFFSPNDEWFGWEKLHYDSINKIIYVHSHSQFEDPDHKIENFIISKGFKECAYFKRINTGYTLFVKENMECNSVKVITEIETGTNDVMKQYLVLSQKEDTCLFYNMVLEASSAQSIAGDSLFLPLNESGPFSPGVNCIIEKLGNRNSILVNATVYCELQMKGELVVSIEKQSKILFRKGVLFDSSLVKNKWDEVTLECLIPEDAPSDAVIKIYIWNPSKERVLLKKFNVLFGK